MTLNEWVQLNVGIEGCGNDIPLHVQMGIYSAVSGQQLQLNAVRSTPSLKAAQPSLKSS
eukprot:CAMPEP_0114689896 /NCGR_PEP_ID=MMETSP0191-20121206/65070_1 /TAXON_ID=126664 /ORGANISM="Sorites sp." /LENGTH=58 /DNA_ID=CAMNT_0001979105 /DNA_START=3 /DNA_END=175 /DNA_ORIENTATION=+